MSNVGTVCLFIFFMFLCVALCRTANRDMDMAIEDSAVEVKAPASMPAQLSKCVSVIQQASWCVVAVKETKAFVEQLDDMVDFISAAAWNFGYTPFVVHVYVCERLN